MTDRKKQDRLNKRALARRISEHGGMTIDQAEACLTSLVEVFRYTMEHGGEIALQHMGTFSVAERNERLNYNPATGRHIVLETKKRVKFTPSGTLILGTNEDDAASPTIE